MSQCLTNSGEAAVISRRGTIMKHTHKSFVIDVALMGALAFNGCDKKGDALSSVGHCEGAMMPGHSHGLSHEPACDITHQKNNCQVSKGE